MELYAISCLKIKPVKRAEGQKKIELGSLIKRAKFRAVEFLIVEYENANIDEGETVIIVDYLKTLQPILKTETAKLNYNKTI